MKTHEVIPNPSRLMDSLRNVGYTVEAAIADLIDNSISAGADVIGVEYDAIENPFVAIIDNGKGMTHEELLAAMRHGGPDVPADRNGTELGRFGLGLKTASLSQCRRMTVLSKSWSGTSALVWDLDLVNKTGKWLVQELDRDNYSVLPCYEEFEELTHGTLVVWQNLDRLLVESADAASEMKVKMRGLLEHLALVFHRFTEKESGYQKISISVNSVQLPRRDPFLRSFEFHQAMEPQEIRHEPGIIHVQPYLLPPLYKLDAAQRELAGGIEGLRSSQGFYLYRARRLVIWGTWFRIVPKEEFYKLARIKVDVPNCFDHLWSLDIKKSQADPPRMIRERLKELLPHFTTRSKETITYRGRVRTQHPFEPIWRRREPQHGHWEYEINDGHPVIHRLFKESTESQASYLRHVFAMISVSLPYDGIYADMCSVDGAVNEADAESRIRDLFISTVNSCEMPPEYVLKTDPFVQYPDLHEKLMKGLQA